MHTQKKWNAKRPLLDDGDFKISILIAPFKELHIVNGYGVVDLQSDSSKQLLQDFIEPWGSLNSYAFIHICVHCTDADNANRCVKRSVRYTLDVWGNFHVRLCMRPASAIWIWDNSRQGVARIDKSRVVESERSIMLNGKSCSLNWASVYSDLYGISAL